MKKIDFVYFTLLSIRRSSYNSVCSSAGQEVGDIVENVLNPLWFSVRNAVYYAVLSSLKEELK